MEYVILVDNKDKEIGIEEKIKAHVNGSLHRAISVLVFNSSGELLIQQRSPSKYHFPNKWSNTVCTHPRPYEHIDDAVHRRLKEEMGFDCKIRKQYSFIYRTEFENLIENEFDHVFFGKYDGAVIPNSEEVKNYEWVSGGNLGKDLNKNLQKYTPWFIEILRRAKLQDGL